MTGTRTALPLRVIHRGWNTFGIATLTQPDGSTVPRALEDHGEAACVLPYDPERRVALLVRPSRVGPAFWGEPPALDEAPAGGLDGGEPLGPLDRVVAHGRHRATATPGPGTAQGAQGVSR